jgi:hypothetical protein
MNVEHLIHTSVDDCRTSVNRCTDVEYLYAAIAYMDANDIEHKTRRKIIQARIRKLEK